MPQVLLCTTTTTTTLPPNYFQKQSRWECCRSDGLLLEGGPFKGYPLLSRARTSTPRGQAEINCHRIALPSAPCAGRSEKSKQAIRAGPMGMNCDRPVIFELGPLGIEDEEALIAR